MPFNVKENDWIALCAAAIRRVCRWYPRGGGGPHNAQQPAHAILESQRSRLHRLDRHPADAAVSIGKSIIGVYTEPVQVDRDPLW